MITICAFKLDDLDMIEPIASVVPHMVLKGKHLRNGPSVTLVDDGYIFACGGVMRTSPGVGTLWIRVDKSVTGKRARILSIFNVSADMLAFAKIAMGMHRLQATAFVLNRQAINFLLRLGLVPEGILKHFGPNGEDAYMFATYGEVNNGMGRGTDSGAFAAHNGHASGGQHLSVQESEG